MTTNTAVLDGAFSTSISYDALNRAVGTRSSYWNGGAWVTGDTDGTIYDAFGESVALTVNGTKTTQSIYDNAGRVIASNSGDGTWKAYGNDGNGNTTLTIQSAGTTDLSSFITAGSSGGTDTSTYNFAGALALALSNGQPTAANGLEVTTGTFDGRNQQLQSIQFQRQIDNSGTLYNLTSLVSYDAFGDVISQTDARGNTTRFQYNTEGRLTAQIDPTVSIASGNGTSVNGNPTAYDYYDLSGRLIATRDADGNLTTRGLLAGTGYGNTQALETAEYHPDGGIIHNSYDAFGDVLTQTDALGYVTTDTYDNSGDLIQVSHPTDTINTDGSAGSGNQLIDYHGYDGLGQQVSQSNSQFGTGVTEATAYDAQGRVISSTDFLGNATKYIYTWETSQGTNGLANYGGWTKTTQDIASGVTSSDTTDAFGHEIAKTDFGGDVYTLTYNKAGELVAQTSTTPNQVLENGLKLTAGQSVYSPNHAYKLIYQNDGNLVIYNSAGTAVWATMTNNN